MQHLFRKVQTICRVHKALTKIPYALVMSFAVYQYFHYFSHCILIYTKKNDGNISYTSAVTTLPLVDGLASYNEQGRVVSIKERNFLGI